jgi:hypothetical protein
MKKLIFSLVLIAGISFSAQSQHLRMVMGVGGGKNFTVGQTFVGYSSGSPTKLWQGFWVPKSTFTSVNEETFKQVQNISKIYPNPASSFFNVESTEQIQTVQIHGIAGETVYDGNVNYISIDNLPSNVYIVKVIHTSGLVNFHKLVITR